MERLVKYIIGLFTDKTFMKFVIVGIVNTIVGTTIMFVFYNVFGLSYWISSASNYFFGSICSYILNKHFLINISHSKIRNMDGNRLCASRLIS